MPNAMVFYSFDLIRSKLQYYLCNCCKIIYRNCPNFIVANAFCLSLCPKDYKLPKINVFTAKRVYRSRFRKFSRLIEVFKKVQINFPQNHFSQSNPDSKRKNNIYPSAGYIVGRHTFYHGDTTIDDTDQSKMI